MTASRAVFRIAILLTALAILALATACGSGESPAPESQASKPPAPSQPSPPSEPTPPDPPDPPEIAAADPAKGEADYQVYCASCHGPRGAGDGPAAAALDPKPARHTDGSYMNALSNDELFKVISEGGAAVGKSPLMAPWGGSLSQEQIRDVVAFVRSLADPPYEGPAP